ncbi:MAG: endonuclease III [Gemmatimonadetes bacterium]|nr:endonuclease III [Gemmatimonadota bacterium]
MLRELEKAYPEAATALEYETPFQLLVATILSAQCTDARVNTVTPDLFADHPDPPSFREMSQEELEAYIRTCGLYRNKAKNILATARMLGAEFGDEVPDSREALMRLPGVGRKTANVVLAHVHSADAIAVDTHVFRVSRRLGLARGDTPRRVEEELMQALPRETWARTHHRLIFHGRRICKAVKPRCEACPVSAWCDWYRERRRDGE